MEQSREYRIGEKRLKIENLKLPDDLKELNLKQCETLCAEIRKILIKTVSETGGHLASNLGTVELTLAIHRVFDSPNDKIVWDVGHQSYTHKILTGRLKDFSTLRQENGISGFPKPEESEHDAFVSGHSSTSISVACGIAEAMKLKGENHSAVAVIGDGAFTGGMAYEGLNNAGKSNTNIIVILNHNDMSISKNVGAFAKYIQNIRNKQRYINTKIAVGETLERMPVVGEPIKNVLKVSKNALKSVVIHSTMFEDLGFVYLGPVDGHDLKALEEVLRIAKDYRQPVFVHVNTVKGKGYAPAEKNPGEYHGISKFDIKTGNPETSSDNSFSVIFGKELSRLAENDERICAVTAAMKYGTGLQYFASEHKSRFFDVGIAEQHAVTFASGLASMGMLPVFAVYSTFLQRAYDQLIHDVAIEGTHVVIGIDRAGIVGEDGETHQGMFDIPMLTTIPNVTIYSPACYEEVKACLKRALYDDKGLVCVRYPKGEDNSAFEKTDSGNDYSFHFSSHENTRLAISYGRVYDNLEKAQNSLENQGIYVDCLKLTRIFPLADELKEKIKAYREIWFFEESYRYGSISECLISELDKADYTGIYKSITADGFVKQASVASCLAKIGLDTEHIEKRLSEDILSREKDYDKFIGYSRAEKA